MEPNKSTTRSKLKRLIHPGENIQSPVESGRRSWPFKSKPTCNRRIRTSKSSKADPRKGFPAVAFKTLYTWLYAGLLHRDNLQLSRHKGKHQKPPEKRGYFTVGTSIRYRTNTIRDRKTFGH